MSIWRSAFLHEFPKGNLKNYLGSPGTLSFQGLGATSTLTPPKGFLLNPSRWLRYDFEEGFDRVIGVDITLSGTAFIPIFLIFPPKPSPYFQIASVGNGLVKLHIGVEGTSNSGRVKLEIGSQSMTFEDLAVPNSFGQVPFKLRARWHTTGQVHVWWNDDLIAYEPKVAAGNSFSIDDVAIGEPNEAGSGFLPSMDVTYFYVKVLRDNDAETKLIQEIELDPECFDPDDPCWERVEKLQLDITQAYRRLMGSAIEKLTQPWRNKDNGLPFSNKSIEAHEAAKAAFAAFLMFLRDNNLTQRNEYLQRIEQFLRIIASTDPDLFAETLELVQRHEASIPEECRTKMELIFNHNIGQLEELRFLMDETMAIINKIAGAVQCRT